jgi:hypothetical protein
MGKVGKNRVRTRLLEATMQVFGTQEQGYAIFRELSESFEASSCQYHCAPLIIIAPR